MSLRGSGYRSRWALGSHGRNGPTFLTWPAAYRALSWGNRPIRETSVAEASLIARVSLNKQLSVPFLVTSLLHNYSFLLTNM